MTSWKQVWQCDPIVVPGVSTPDPEVVWNRALELVADRESREPLRAEAMGRIGAACKAEGVWPLVMANRVHVVPPCVITADEARHALEVLGRALSSVRESA